MGLFQQLPEDPEEWAGLPSEPLGPESAASRLSTDVDNLTALGGVIPSSSAVESIVIPVTPFVEAALSQPEGGEDRSLG